MCFVSAADATDDMAHNVNVTLPNHVGDLTLEDFDNEDVPME